QKHLSVLGGANDGWDAFQPRRPGGTDSPLPHHDLVALAGGTHHDRLEHTDSLDAGGEVLERLPVKGFSRLPGIRIDGVEWKLRGGGTRGLLGLCRRRLLLGSLGHRFLIVLRAAWDQRFESTAEATTATHQLAPSPGGASKTLG